MSARLRLYGLLYEYVSAAPTLCDGYSQDSLSRLSVLSRVAVCVCTAVGVHTPTQETFLKCTRYR